MHIHSIRIRILILFLFSFNFRAQDVIFQRIQPHVMEMCVHLYGCRVIQCILQHGSVPHRNNIFEDIWRNPHSVISNRYGNYVVQHLASMYILFSLHFNDFFSVFLFI